MEYENFDQLKADVGLAKIEECSQQENFDFAEMEQNGQLLLKVSSDKEALYVLMRISKDLHFIKVLLVVSLTLAVIVFCLVW